MFGSLFDKARERFLALQMYLLNREPGLPRPAYALILCIAAASLALVTFGPMLSPKHFPSHAAAQPAPPAETPLAIPPGETLVSVSWACHPGGYCEPWILTKPHYRGHTPQQYRFRNPKTGAFFTITESHAQD